MKELKPVTHPVKEEMEAMSFSTLDFDLILDLFEEDFFTPPPDESPAEEAFDPQQPPTGGDMPHGAAPFGLEQPVLHAPGFQAAPTDLPLLPPYYAPAEEGFGPQQPPTGGDMPHGAAPFGLEQTVLPAPGPAPPVYQPPSAPQPSFMPLAAPRRRRQVRTSLGTDRFITTLSILMWKDASYSLIND